MKIYFVYRGIPKYIVLLVADVVGLSEALKL